MRVAFVFPGQGSQEVGMGRDLASQSPAARSAFDEADAALHGDSRPLSALCFDGPAEDLTLTANTQPAILTTSIACLRALRERIPSLTPTIVAGHSLGEYSALVAAGALDLADTVKLVRLRGQAMQSAVPAGIGAMVAVMNMDPDAIEQTCAAVRTEMTDRVVSPANFNAPGQVVVAGHADAVQRFSELAAQQKGRLIPLKVSAPFHCALMKPAADALQLALEAVATRRPAMPVVANVDATPYDDEARIKPALVAQVAGAVRWEQSVRAMVAQGIETFIEIGPGRVLSGLIRRTHKAAVIHNVSDAASLDATAQSLASAS